MRFHIKNIFYFFMLVLSLGSCVDPYEPPAITNAESFLVVEGFLNANGPTKISLSKTAKLSEEISSIPEDGAILSVENINGKVAEFNELKPGIYSVDVLDLDFQEEYRLKIITKDDNIYYSEFVPVKKSPEINDIYWNEEPYTEVNIFLNTADEVGNSNYYRWEFEEAWEFSSFYKSWFMYKDGAVIMRDSSNQVNICYQNNYSENILTTSTVKLGEDVVHKFPITTIPYPNWKLSRRYSILVEQYPLTKEGYEFYELLKKNSEELGSFFDPQPSEIRGNFYNASDEDQLVIGFISAGTVATKLIFIDNAELTEWDNVIICEVKEVGLDSVEYYFGSGNLIPLIQEAQGPILATSPLCGDCTLRGILTKPSYWQ